jgi:hypothetical protein
MDPRAALRLLKDSSRGAGLSPPGQRQTSFAGFKQSIPILVHATRDEHLARSCGRADVPRRHRWVVLKHWLNSA